MLPRHRQRGRLQAAVGGVRREAAVGRLLRRHAEIGLHVFARAEMQARAHGDLVGALAVDRRGQIHVSGPAAVAVADRQLQRRAGGRLADDPAAHREHAQERSLDVAHPAQFVRTGAAVAVFVGAARVVRHGGRSEHAVREAHVVARAAACRIDEEAVAEIGPETRHDGGGVVLAALIARHHAGIERHRIRRRVGNGRQRRQPDARQQDERGDGQTFAHGGDPLEREPAV